MLKFAKVDTQESFEQWREFARSFGHDSESPTMPIYTVSRGDRMFGHFHVLQNHPIIFPAYHPDHCSPRDFVDMSEAIGNTYCMASISTRFPNGVCYAALPINSTVSEEKIGKVGFLPTGHELFRRVPL